MPVKTPLPYQPYIRVSQRLRITLREPIEQVLSPAVALPTSEPATAQYSRQISDADLPIYMPDTALRLNVGLVQLVGQNTTAAAITLFWRMLKGGQSLSLGSISVPANNFWRLGACFFDIVRDEPIAIRLWASAAGLNYDYNSFQAHPTRVGIFDTLNQPQTAQFENVFHVPVLTSTHAPGGTVSLEGCRLCHLDIGFFWISSPVALEVIVPRPILRFFRCGWGDWTSVNTGTAVVATTRGGLPPMRNAIPTEITATVWRIW